MLLVSPYTMPPGKKTAELSFLKKRRAIPLLSSDSSWQHYGLFLLLRQGMTRYQFTFGMSTRAVYDKSHYKRCL